MLDPFIWPSALVGLPIGFIAGAAIAVLGYRFLTRGRGSTVDWRTVGVGAVAVMALFGLLVGGLSLLRDQRVDRTTESTYKYRVSQVYYREVQNETMGWHERIEPGEYDPSDPTMGVQHDGSLTFTVALGSNESIETADLFGTEPLLEPRD